jgi:serine/threonine protein kinase
MPLDKVNRWFRYHHLFQKLLINQLNRRSSAEEIKALHAKAGAWLAENGIIEEAVRHYLGADDIPVAIQLVARHGHNLMNNQQWPDLERLIGMIPRDHVEQEAAMNGTTVHCGNFLLHLQERAGCDAPVLIKEPAYERPTRSYCDQLHNEYDITQQLTDVAGVRPVYAIEGTESQPVVLMEYIQGRSLAELIRADSLDLAEKLQLAVNVTAVLSRIHEHQVMHKDMSSSNILVADKDEPGSQGGVYVIDFGIASVMQQKSVSHPATDDTLVGIIERIEPLAPDTAKGLRTLLGNFQIGLISDLLGENNEQ